MSDREKLSRAVKTIKELDFDVFLFRRLSNYISRNKGIEEEKATLETQAQRLPLLLTKLEGQRTKITNLDAECCGLKTEVSKLRPFAEKYDKFEKQRSELEEGRRTIIKNITTCKTQIQESLNQLDEIQRTKSEVKVLEKKIKQQALEIRAYKKLSEEIFGKDGIPTEILREKVPEIESESSEILSQISNGKFFTSINFSRKEEIVVQAVDINGEHPVFRFSAGEKMKINMALRLGISEVIAKRKGSKGKLETLIIDEGFGQLDTEGRKAVIGVINSLMERFKKIIVISHLEDIKDTFDTKLLVENIGGYSKVRIVS
jgi:exonuclease SbcC